MAKKQDPLINSIEFNSSLGCGECIAGGFSYCWKNTEPGLILTDDEMPVYSDVKTETKSICCSDTEDFYFDCFNILIGLQQKTREWTCSSSFNNPTYSMFSCPFKKSSCGPFNQVSFQEQEDDGSIHISNLKKGDTCTYNIETRCGAPSFSTIGSDRTKIFYAEWQQDKISKSVPFLAYPPLSKEMMESSPKEQMPVRNSEFEDELSRTSSEGKLKTGEYQHS